MRSERAIIGLVGAVQFVNIVDFMMVMPLGPDFAVALGVDVDQIGLVGGAYTLAAGVVGLVASPWLDRVDRRRALAICMTGLAVGTALGGFAQGLPSLIAARLLAGAFGGPATSVALAIVADVIPNERRGRAMAAVMTAFSIASVAGVPAGLVLSELWSWRAPFFVLAAGGAMITALSVWLLPPMLGHLDASADRPGLLALAGLPAARAGLLATGLATGSAFVLVPNLSAFIQFNLGYPRAELPRLYVLGGVSTLIALRVFGGLADRSGPVPLSLAGTVAFGAIGLAWFTTAAPPLPIWVLFPAMMLALSARNVAHQSVLSQVAPPALRAAFQSLNSSVQHVAASIAAVTATAVLGTAADGRLLGIPSVAFAAIALAAGVPPLLAIAARKSS